METGAVEAAQSHAGVAEVGRQVFAHAGAESAVNGVGVLAKLAVPIVAIAALGGILRGAVRYMTSRGSRS